ncbi:MAG: TolC family protein [Acidobacteriota bacterium]
MTRALVWALLAGCAPSLPDVRIPQVELPAAYDASVAGRSIARIDWATFFADDDLVTLIGDALRGNFDLQLAVQRIELARAGILEISGQRLPRLSLVGEAGVRKYARYTVDGAGNAGVDIAPGEVVPTHVPDLFLGARASWEPDLWSRLGSKQGAARARYLATIEAHHLVTTSLVADTATAYFSLVALDETARVLTETIAHQSEALDMMRVQKEAGRTNELAVRQFAAELASTRALAEHVQAETRDLELQVAVLLGHAPAPIARNPDALSRPVPALATGVPSALLRDRPDIRQAELDVQASRLDLAAARAAFYPRITISADAGYEAFDPRFLLRTPASLAYSLVAGIASPLVNRRGIEAAFRAASASQIAAMINYQSVVLRGFADAASALSHLQHTGTIVVHQQQRKDALVDSVEAANELFQAGHASYLDVLLAQQQTLQAELDVIAARRDHQIAKVQLYRALGGGWTR